MALLYRKTLRDAIQGVLSDVATGFNPRLAAMATAYGITAYTIDFTGASQNFALSNIDPRNVELCALLDFPAICLYTEDARDSGDSRQYGGFTGKVIACLKFIIRSHNGIEGFNTEADLDAAEDAIISAINNPNIAWPGGVIPTRETLAQREHLMPLGDGYGSVISIQSTFEVYVNHF